ncbi:MAG: hypothetical protein JW966_04530 [Anaerolineae bacterium]|nr:hypothetical protein [Anaerolineae bacterium]
MFDDFPDEVAQPLKQIEQGLSQLVKMGIVLLHQGLEQHPEYDVSKGYKAKNAYFNPSNQIGLWLLKIRPSWIAEQYYGNVLREILAYEKANDKYVNKGIAYANLAISQMISKEFDCGIAYLLWTEWEDRDFVEDNIRKTLWKQFEQNITQFILTLIQDDGELQNLIGAPNETLKRFLDGIDPQNYYFFCGTILAIKKNSELIFCCPNIYTYGRLYSCLKDLCLLTESLLRDKNVGEDTQDKTYTINALLKMVFDNQNVHYPQSDLKESRGANSLAKFLSHFENIKTRAETPQLRWAHCLHLVRNFTGHHFKPSESEASFFEKYEEMLVMVLSAILYFKSIDVI